MNPLKILRGIGIPETWVGLARGLTEAFIMGGLAAVAAEIGAISIGTEQVLLGTGAIAVIRMVEGLIDHIDPGKPRKPEPVE